MNWKPGSAIDLDQRAAKRRRPALEQLMDRLHRDLGELWLQMQQGNRFLQYLGYVRISAAGVQTGCRAATRHYAQLQQAAHDTEVVVAAAPETRRLVIEERDQNTIELPAATRHRNFDGRALVRIGR